MATWVSIFERQPKQSGNYFVKINGDRRLLHLNDFDRAVGSCETFLWLDEYEEEKKKLDELLNVANIDDFCKLDYRTIAEKLVVPYKPYIPKSIVSNTYHKYYLRTIGHLRNEIAQLSKGKTVIRTVDVLKPIKYEQSNVEYNSEKSNPLIDRLKILNSNSFF